MALDKTSLEYQFMAEYFKLMREFWEPKPEQIWWNKFHEALNQLASKYDNTFAIEHLALFAHLQEKKGGKI